MTGCGGRRLRGLEHPFSVRLKLAEASSIKKKKNPSTGSGRTEFQVGDETSEGPASIAISIVSTAAFTAALFFGFLAFTGFARLLLAHAAAVVAVGFFLAGGGPIGRLRPGADWEGRDVERRLGDAGWKGQHHSGCCDRYEWAHGYSPVSCWRAWHGRD